MVRVVRPRFLTRTTQKERRDQRKDVTLTDAAITERTQKRYYFAVRFLLPILQKVPHMGVLDDHISAWVEEQWKAGQTLSFVSDALCGLHHFEPSTKRTIGNTWKLFRTWRKLEAPNRAPPLTKEIVYAIAYYAISHDDLIFAALMLIGFFAMLRTGEILNVKPCDCMLGATDAVISLPVTKTGVRHGAGETIALSDLFALDSLREAILLRQSQNCTKTPFWVQSAQSFRNRFGHYIKKFKLQSHNFRPYSLRRGGATFHFKAQGQWKRPFFLDGGPLPKLQRFTSRMGCRAYLPCHFLRIHCIC